MYEKIRQLRIEQNMYQEDLAIALGYKDRSMITKIESGKVDISQKKIMAFAKALNTTPGYLMGWTDKKESSDGPKTIEAQILAEGIDKLSKEEREQALNVVRAMFAHHADFFKKGNNSDDA